MNRKTQPVTWGSFDPNDVHLLREVFDQVWASLAPEIGKCCDDMATARDQLASILVQLAKDRQLNALQITRTSTRLLRERYNLRCNG
jgi:hypothetical protein